MAIPADIEQDEISAPHIGLAVTVAMTHAAP
jgi:hypothetical protein